MDMKCATCDEPWEHHHLLCDLPWETWDGDDDSSSHLLIKKFLEGPRTTIPDMLREDLKEQGWVFGKTIVCVLECGCCESNTPMSEKPEVIAERKELRKLTESLMPDDLDGLISQLTSVDLYCEVG